MTFPANRNIVRKMEALVKNIVEAKELCVKAKRSVTAGDYRANELLDLVRGLNLHLDAIKALKQDLNLNGGSPGSLVEGLDTVITNISDLLLWVKDNIPTSNGFLLLYSMTADFELEPRTFSNAALVPLRTKLTAIIQEISTNG